MEFPFSLHGLFGEEISLVDGSCAPYRKASNEPLDKNLAKVIDDLGEASAKAQGLHGPITATYKLRSSDHRMYVLKDGEANSGKGAAVGFIKVGKKKLFILDHHGAQVELTPLCVLDFYVHESRQRTGCGHRLFQHMLKMEKISPQHLAIDRPSNKFTRFLKKHYGLAATVPQVNNFVVFEGFFRDNPGSTVPMRQRGSARNLQQEKAALQNIAVSQGRPSSTGLLISRFQQQHDITRNRSSSLGNLAAVELEDRRMGAQASRYSRYAQEVTGRRSSAQNSAGLPGSTTGQAGSTTGQPGSIATQAGSTTGMPGSTAGQAGSSAGLAGSTGGVAGSTGRLPGSTMETPGALAGQAGSTGGYVHYKDITTRNGHLKVSSQLSPAMDRQRIPGSKAVVSSVHPPSANQAPAATIDGCSMPRSPSLRQSDAVLKERDLSYTVTQQGARRENSFWNVMGVPTTSLKDRKNNQRTNNIW
ncbi:PREDICTED: alpha-tubulin N-acetyltransferase 1-like isoform X2 [Branchiostoma belcheri]|uniref:Alpha-tubulin N-acetyltransferase n=1 Tax=Branchiostoma belcheri TaxID=7741 RepID=A0A6P4Y5W9_BRABE|nr:PREDICTED: alpha-tubulin N-acetyltransferase 1-like isoform X2 [Branchiostoma belcheri]